MEDPQPCPSRNLAAHGGKSKTDIPLDITLEILSKLPPKSIIRFQSVSKLWFSTIRSKDLTNLFLKRSRTRPRFLITLTDFDSWNRFIFSAPEVPNNDVVVARHDMTLPDLKYDILSNPVNGFVCCRCDSSLAVCNPATRQMVKLPDVVELNGRNMYTSLGYDPVEDQYKVLCVMIYNDPRRRLLTGDIKQGHLVCTVRSGQKLRWRKIQTEPYGFVSGGKICIDGAIYYGVEHTRIARFDVRSEKIDFIQGPFDFDLYSSTALVNHQGKLACVGYGYKRESKIHLWVLQDAEWSRTAYRGLPSTDEPLHIRGFHNSEVMRVSTLLSSKLFCVSYYHLIRDDIRRVEIDGIADSEFRRIHQIRDHERCIFSSPGHIENIAFL